MATELKLRRGTTAQHSNFTGAEGEVTIDSDKDVPVVHDGATQGGFPLAKAFQLSDITSLSSLNTAALVDGRGFSLKGWRPGANYGGGVLEWDASLAKSNHNGGSIFSPTVPAPANFDLDADVQGYLDGTGETDPSGSGCFVRRETGTLTLADFGLSSTGTISVNIPFNAAILAQSVIGKIAVGFSVGAGFGSTPEFTTSGNMTVLQKGRPDNGTFEIDLTGIVISGSNSLILDSCKSLILRGIQAPNHNIEPRGLWFTEVFSSKFSVIVFGEPGTAFTSTYWNDWHNGVYQQIEHRGNATVNSNRFHGSSFRGSADQGFAQTRNSWIKTAGTQNMQALAFFGGDASYYDDDLQIDLQGTGDAEITLYNMYLDSETPRYSGLLPNQYIRAVDCHIAGKYVGSIPLSGAVKAHSSYHGNLTSVGWEPNIPLNLIPNGDLSQGLDDYSISNHGPIGAKGNATVTEVSDATYGRLLNIVMPDGDASQTLFRFRSVPLPYDSKYSMAVLIRSAAEKTLNFQIGGQFFNGAVGPDWRFVISAAQEFVLAGSADDILMRSEDGFGYDVEVAYIGLVAGTHPPLIVGQHHLAQAADLLRASEIRVGDIADVFRPRVLSGSGSPEGVVEAPRGSTFLRNDGGAGTSFYVKESGTGNTGWAGK